ncbi:hypothetical protein ACOSQ2_026669 [Xanthoceras sorbifolium]
MLLARHYARRGRKPVKRSLNQKFSGLCDFVDLGFSGPLFTWNNKRGGARNVQERLDRFFATSLWVNLFSGIKEELYWKQRSRVDWLLAGDKNSKFFHRRATARKKKNMISSLVDGRGIRRESEQGMSNVVLDYFSDLFKSIQPSSSDFSAASSFLEHKVNAHMAGRLGEAFTRAEVRAAVFEMGPNKAPGPDGFHALFFQKFWNVVGEDVSSVCLNVLNAFQDPWIPRESTFRPFSNAPVDDLMVASLISPASRSWDLAKIDQVFVAADRDSILEIPLSLGDCNDSLIWHFNKNGEYSVKSGYRVAAQEKLSLKGSSSKNFHMESLPQRHSVSVVAASAKPLLGFFPAELGELLALREGLLLAKEFNLIVEWVELDAVNVVARVSNSFPCSVMDPIISDVKALFRAVGVSTCHVIPRSGNGMAHSLASLAFSSNEEFCWFNPEPSFLVGLL